MSERGFTLTETVMALVLASSVMLGLLGALSSARSMADEARARATALSAAQAVLAQLDHGLLLADIGPAPQDGLQWHVIRQRRNPSKSAEVVTVVMPWRSGIESGEIRLEAYRWGGHER
ncbi:type II secretion system protein [Maricaulis sp.]|uniref:type IV pilus modification PilV family protein n=1 Tax=Maricaulis sp. TaxID=1486257 RepID=UPI00262486F6|nr:type II secretion system protein [Maricaulis sp.]